AIMKILHVVGARPNFVKAAPLTRALPAVDGSVHQLLVHTGQHYDAQMSDVFFRELDMPAPDVNLDVGSASHAVQTAQAMEGIDGARVRFVGNLMIDTLVRLLPRTEDRPIRDRLGPGHGAYVLVTLHRPSNVDDDAALREIVAAVVELANDARVIFPVHPRT